MCICVWVHAHIFSLDLLKPRARFHVLLLHKPGGLDFFFFFLPFKIRIKNSVEQVISVTLLISISCLIFWVLISLSIVIPGWNSSLSVCIYEKKVEIYNLLIFCPECIQENIQNIKRIFFINFSQDSVHDITACTSLCTDTESIGANAEISLTYMWSAGAGRILESKYWLHWKPRRFII